MCAACASDCVQIENFYWLFLAPATVWIQVRSHQRGVLVFPFLVSFCQVAPKCFPVTSFLEKSCDFLLSLCALGRQGSATRVRGPNNQTSSFGAARVARLHIFASLSCFSAALLTAQIFFPRVEIFCRCAVLNPTAFQTLFGPIAQ
jgi:hypothetical protein